MTDVETLQWYHTIELPGGVVTPGWFDTRPAVAKVPLPESLAGKRCLDVGTWDGFWAFEMERRGATDVTAIDLQDQSRWDWPPGMALQAVGQQIVEDFKSENAAFNHAREALGSNVERRDVSVYDLDPATHGTFDFVFLGTLLLHLRDPVRALAALRSVTDGEAVIADSVDAFASLVRPRTPTARLEGVDRPWWWQPNRAALLQMLRSAGFEILEATKVYYVPRGTSHPPTPFPRNLHTAEGREALVIKTRGFPHVAARVRPSR